jgi:hypothetical protein
MVQTIRELLRAVKIDPPYLKAYDQFGNVCVLSGSVAEGTHSQVKASVPGNAETQYDLAQAEGGGEKINRSLSTVGCSSRRTSQSPMPSVGRGRGSGCLR